VSLVVHLEVVSKDTVFCTTQDIGHTYCTIIIANVGVSRFREDIRRELGILRSTPNVNLNDVVMMRKLPIRYVP
jgi:hypothetical protein